MRSALITPVRVPRVADMVSVRMPVRRLIARQEFSLLLVVLAIGIATTVKSPHFLTHENVILVLEGSVTYFIMACGSALLIIGGGLDFSVGASFTLGGLVTAKLLSSGTPIPPAILLGLASCFLVGAVNFVVVTYWHVPPIIATLGTFYVLLGITNQITGGNDVVPLPNAFQAIAQNKIIGIPNTIVFAAILGVVSWLVLDHTTFGVNVRALGGNRTAAIGNGLPVKRLDLAIYVSAAATAGLAGILYASSVGSGQVNAGGATSTLDAVTAVLIGGVSLLGGLGTIQGIAIGSILLSLIDNSLVLTGVPPTYDTIIIGTILIAAVALDHLRRERIYRKR